MSPEPPSPPRDAQAGEDPADYEEYEDFSSLPDTRSIASDDSFYPYGDEEEYSSVSAESAPEAVPEGVPEAATLLRAACANDVGLLRALVRRGPSAEEVQETDRNGRVRARPRGVRGPSALLGPGPEMTLPRPRARFPGSTGAQRARRPGQPAHPGPEGAAQLLRGHSAAGTVARPACSPQPLLVSRPRSLPMLPWGPHGDLSWGVSRVPSLRSPLTINPPRLQGKLLQNAPVAPSAPRVRPSSCPCALPSMPERGSASARLPGSELVLGRPASSHPSLCSGAAEPGDPRGGRTARSPTGLSARSPRRAGGHRALPSPGQVPGGEHSRAAVAQPQGRRAWGWGEARGIHES